MKPLLKVALIKTLLFLMTSSAAATTLHTQAFSYFNDPAGNRAQIVGRLKTLPSRDA